VGREDIVDEVLVSGLDDWVMLVQVESLVRQGRGGLSPDTAIGETVGAVAEMLTGGLVEVGDVREPAGFMPWGVPPADAVARIRSEWRALGRDLEMGDICWLSNTALGDERAAQIRDERNV
jgi:hypothetical protein